MPKINRRLAGFAAATAVLTTTFAGAAPAMAERTPLDADGLTTLRIGGTAIAALQSGECGAIVATPTGDGTVKTVRNGVRVQLPITSAVATDAGHLRIAHASSGFELMNNCYDVRFTNLYIQDLGDGEQTTTIDVLAKTIADGENDGRQLSFQLDTTNARGRITRNGAGARVTHELLNLGSDGADQFNTLVTGDPAAGPFAAGQQIGSGKIVITRITQEEPPA